MINRFSRTFLKGPGKAALRLKLIFQRANYPPVVYWGTLSLFERERWVGIGLHALRVRVVQIMNPYNLRELYKVWKWITSARTCFLSPFLKILLYRGGIK